MRYGARQRTRRRRRCMADLKAGQAPPSNCSWALPSFLTMRHYCFCVFSYGWRSEKGGDPGSGGGRLTRSAPQELPPPSDAAHPSRPHFQFPALRFLIQLKWKREILWSHFTTLLSTMYSHLVVHARVLGAPSADGEAHTVFLPAAAVQCLALHVHVACERRAALDGELGKQDRAPRFVRDLVR